MGQEGSVPGTAVALWMCHFEPALSAIEVSSSGEWAWTSSLTHANRSHTLTVRKTYKMMFQLQFLNVKDSVPSQPLTPVQTNIIRAKSLIYSFSCSRENSIRKFYYRWKASLFISCAVTKKNRGSVASKRKGKPQNHKTLLMYWGGRQCEVPNQIITLGKLIFMWWK